MFIGAIFALCWLICWTVLCYINKVGMFWNMQYAWLKPAVNRFSCTCRPAIGGLRFHRQSRRTHCWPKIDPNERHLISDLFCVLRYWNQLDHASLRVMTSEYRMNSDLHSSWQWHSWTTLWLWRLHAGGFHAAGGWFWLWWPLGSRVRRRVWSPSCCDQDGSPVSVRCR